MIQREIKFRAKRKDGLGWAYGYFMKTPITTEFNCDGQFLDSGGIGRYCIIQNGCAHEIITGTLGQFTGYKDMENVEIYEGDILDPSKREVLFVEYESPFGMGTGWCTKAHANTDWPEMNECAFSMTSRQIDSSKVVGNIHDNPELLDI